MSEAIDTTLVRSGTWGSLWIDGEQVAECYGCQAKISKTKESVPRCRAMMEDSKLVQPFSRKPSAVRRRSGLQHIHCQWSKDGAAHQLWHDSRARHC